MCKITGIFYHLFSGVLLSFATFSIMPPNDTISKLGGEKELNIFKCILCDL